MSTAEQKAQQEYSYSKDRDKWTHDERNYADAFTDLARAAYVKGYAAGQEDRWTSVEDELPPIHEEPFPEEGFVLILFQCADWPGKWKSMKASRTIGDWADDGSPLWFWTDEEGEIIDNDDNLITHWSRIPAPPSTPVTP